MLPVPPTWGGYDVDLSNALFGNQSDLRRYVRPKPLVRRLTSLALVLASHGFRNGLLDLLVRGGDGDQHIVVRAEFGGKWIEREKASGKSTTAINFESIAPNRDVELSGSESIREERFNSA
jgi:hypothetical protein